jgi:hypothetical protein
MRKEGENIIKPPPGKAAIRSTEIMISLLMSKVNVPAVAIPAWELIVDENRRQLDQLSRSLVLKRFHVNKRRATDARVFTEIP